MARPRRPQPAATPSRKQPPAPTGSFTLSRLAGVILLVGSFATGIWWMMRPAPAGPVILISIDTLRADHLSLYGYTKGRTPNSRTSSTASSAARLRTTMANHGASQNGGTSALIGSNGRVITCT